MAWKGGSCKAAAVLVALGYCSLLVYHGSVTFNSQESRTANVQVSDVGREPVTKSSVDDNSEQNTQTKNVTLNDIFISVKTTRYNEFTRLPVILMTWFQLAKQQTWFFTDTKNELHQKQTNNHMIDTNCFATHQLAHLCCKTNAEYDHFLKSGKTWWCHFDDDNYVNIPRLVTVLRQFDSTKEWYLGKPSIDKPIILAKKDKMAKEEDLNKTGSHNSARDQLLHICTEKSCKGSKDHENNNTILKQVPSFWFGTGGAGYCISRSLGLKMIPLTGDGQFIRLCNKIKLPDDVTMGFLIEHILKEKITVVPEFHSHLEQMKLLPEESLKNQVSLSYSSAKPNGWNVINVSGLDKTYDPTRFLSLHCFLFPDIESCPR